MSKILTCVNQVGNIFKEATTRSEMISQILYGEKFCVRKSIGRFYKGYCIFDNYPGFVLKKNFKRITTKNNYRIKAKETSLYQGNISFKKTNKKLLFNSKVSVLKKDNNFIKINKFWIKNNSINKIKNKTNNYLDNISYFLKTKYLWGGNTIKGIDCSGLVQELFKSINKKCPRDSKDQMVFFKKNVPLHNIRRGDLLFWKGHVAIAINQKNLVHAYGPKKRVVIMPIKKTINILLVKNNLKVLAIKRPL